jgi:hypothetical protein
MPRQQTPSFRRGDVLAARPLSQLAGGLAALQRSSNGFGVREALNLRCVIIGSLTAPADTLDVPTTCVVAILRIKSNGRLRVTEERLTVCNFTPGLTAEDGTYAKIEMLDGLWEVYWVDCEPQAALDGLDPEPDPGGGEA